MSLPFLSDDWFAQVKSLRAEAEATLGGATLPAEVLAVKLNISVPHPEGEKRFSLRDGDAHLGHADDADTRVTVDYEVARRLFLEGDVAAGMQAFMAGQIRVEGDMSKLLLLQQHLGAQPTPEQKALRERIIAFTVA